MYVLSRPIYPLGLCTFNGTRHNKEYRYPNAGLDHRRDRHHNGQQRGPRIPWNISRYPGHQHSQSSISCKLYSRYSASCRLVRINCRRRHPWRRLHSVGDSRGLYIIREYDYGRAAADKPLSWERTVSSTTAFAGGCPQRIVSCFVTQEDGCN